MELAAVHDRRIFSPDIPIPECTRKLMGTLIGSRTWPYPRSRVDSSLELPCTCTCPDFLGISNLDMIMRWAGIMHRKSRSEADGMLDSIAVEALVSTPAVEELRYPIVGRAVTKIWGSAEMSVLRLQAREHFRAV